MAPEVKKPCSNLDLPQPIYHDYSDPQQSTSMGLRRGSRGQSWLACLNDKSEGMVTYGSLLAK